MSITQVPQTTTQPASFVDLEHVGPGTPAGNWLRRFWHPVYRSEDLPAGRAKPVRLLGEDFTLYRGESGDVHAVAFRCAHRGTQLSTGWVEGDTLRCFYHGWVFDGNGQCVEQPAEPEPFCNRIKIRSFPVRDYLGLVFVYLGPGEAPPFPRFGIGEEAPFRHVVTTHWPFSYRQALDNKQDQAHFPFVHIRGAKGGQAAARAGHLIDRSSGFPQQRVEETDWGFTSWCLYPDGTEASEHLIMPNGYLHNGSRARLIRWIVPVDDQNHIDITLSLLADEEQAAKYREHGYSEEQPRLDLLYAVLEGRLLPEDVAEYGLSDAVARLGQGVIPDRTQDHLGASDVAPILYRRLYEREIRALAEGRPLKEWSWPLDLHATWSKSE